MTAPKRIQMRRTKGWHKPEGATVVARPSRWGNPFRVGDPAEVVTLKEPEAGFGATIGLTPGLAVALYRSLIEVRLWYPGGEVDDAYTQDWVDALARLRGHDLACWCPLDQPCHADVLLELANQ